MSALSLGDGCNSLHGFEKAYSLDGGKCSKLPATNATYTPSLISLLCNRLQVEVGLPFKAPRGLTVHMLHLEDLY